MVAVDIAIIHSRVTSQTCVGYYKPVNIKAMLGINRTQSICVLFSPSVYHRNSQVTTRVTLRASIETEPTIGLCTKKWGQTTLIVPLSPHSSAVHRVRLKMTQHVKCDYLVKPENFCAKFGKIVHQGCLH